MKLIAHCWDYSRAKFEREKRKRQHSRKHARKRDIIQSYLDSLLVWSTNQKWISEYIDTDKIKSLPYTMFIRSSVYILRYKRAWMQRVVENIIS